MKYRQVFRQITLFVAAACLFWLAQAGTVAAACSNPDQQTCSSSWGVNEVFFGSGGQLCEPGVSGNSTSYCAKSAVGELGIGNTVGTLYQAQGGFDTNREPSLTFCVYDTTCGDNPSYNLGVLTSGSPVTQNAKFAVETYLASGYVVTLESSPPADGAYTMSTPSSPETVAQMTTNSHEFGMHVSATQIPSSSFSFGTVTANYSDTTKYMYQNHDIIAQATKSSGETDYTITYIFNVNNLTPGGTYSFNQVLVATSTF